MRVIGEPRAAPEYDLAQMRDEVDKRQRDYLELIANSVQGICVNAADKPLYVNQAYARMLGYDSAQELLDLGTMDRIISPASLGKVRTMREARMRGEDVPVRYEYDVVRKDGSTITVEAIHCIINWEGQRAIQHAITDVTKLRRSQQKLRESEERYRDLIENSLQGILIRTKERRIVANAAYARIFGYESAEEILALPIQHSMLAPSDRERVHRYDDLRLRGEPAPASFEVQGVRKDGESIWLHEIDRLVTWEGEPAIQITYSDITARKRAEEELRESEQRYKALVEDSAQGVCIRNAERRLFVNTAFARIFGFSSVKDALSGDSPDVMVAPSKRKWMREYYRKRLRGENVPDTYEREHVRKDGSPIWVLSVSQLVEWQDEPAIHISFTDITNQKKSEEELRQSEARYRDLIQGSVQGISILGAKKRLFVNDAFASMLGYDSPEELQDKAPPHRVSAPHERERVDGIHAALIRGKNSTCQYEFEAMRKDGTRIWLNAISRAIEWQGERAMQTTCTDITEQKKSEEELRQSEARYRDLIQGSVQGISIRGAKKRLFANDAFASIFGYDSPEELLAQTPPHSVSAPHEQDRLAKIIRALMKGETESDRYEFEGVGRDGSRIWLNAISRAIEWQGERAVQTACTEITEQKISEQELRESELLYRELIEGSAQGIVIRTKSRIVLANESLARMFGYDTAEDVKRLKRIKFLAAPHERDRVYKYGQGRLRGDPVPSHYEFEGLKADGTRIWVSAVGRLIQWKGQPAIQATFTDITERKRTQDELVAHQLESMGALAKGIAGEFNTIYNTMLSSISLAKMEAYVLGLDKISEILSDAEQTSGQAKDLIQQLLVLSREGAPAKERITVEQIIKESLPFSNSGNVVPLKQDNIKYQLVLSGDLHPISADRVQMKQVFRSIIANGIQSMPFGGTLSISAENALIKPGARGIHLEPGEYIKFTVKDQGQGTPQSSLNKLFDPYFSTDSQHPGLELSSAFAIVKAHEGTITVHSTLGRGTRLTVYLAAIT